MKPKVSVIVPVYNTEKYIRRCVDSIINQTLKDIEIILVDDGSTDRCPEILDEYSINDNRIIVIHKENEGQGSARNMGLDIAKGEFIGFVDSDDWIDLDMYEKLYERVREQKADMAVCNRRVFNEEDKLSTKVDVGNEVFSNINDDLTEFIIEHLLYPYTVGGCNKIYLKELIDDSNIRFKEVKEVGSEDALFNYCFLISAKIVVSINNTCHNQMAREGSTTREYKVGAMKRTSKLIENIYKYSEQNEREKDGKLAAAIMLIFFQQWNYNLIKTYGTSEIKKKLKEEHKQASKNIYFKKAEKSVIFSNSVSIYLKKMGFTFKGRLFIRCYMLSSICNLNGLAASLRVMI